MEKIFIGVAWPYVSGYRHLGHVAGFGVPCDIFARYHRLKGNRVLMVSGSDMHGTPITVRAEQEGKTPAEVANFYHEILKGNLEKLGLSYDLYTTTETNNHKQVVQDMFLTMLKRGYIYKETTRQLFCADCDRFLPDRYVEGTCPFCKFANARGDQCDECGRQIDPLELIDPRCKVCGARPEARESEHFFLDLPKFRDRLDAYAHEHESIWRPNVTMFTRNLLDETLRGRAITRDINWGIPVPVPGYEHKVIYVWFDAVIGYLSAAKEWSAIQGTPEAWREWWEDKDVKSFYFIGKDNIVFHSVIWPAMLLGYAEGKLNLPHDVVSTEFLTMEGRQFSGSRNYAIWLPDYLERYDPDPLRFYLTVNSPETRDSDFSWSEFVRRNNDELVAKWGNFVNRVLSFTHKNFDGKVPTPGTLSPEDNELLAKVDAAFAAVGDLIAARRFKDSIKELMALWDVANVWIDKAEPWKVIKVDRARAATTLFTAFQAIAGLKTLAVPYMPTTSQKCHELLGLAGDAAKGKWQREPIPAGQSFPKPAPLFKKLDEKVIEDELARMKAGG
jgi:methionyl-tRNA synthetase